MGITVTPPKFTATTKRLKKYMAVNYVDTLHEFGKRGVKELSAATPIDSGLSASSWDYEVVEIKGRYKLIWTNSNLADDIPIVLLLQYGHVTKEGGYVPGVDFINPVMDSIFVDLNKALAREVVK